MLKDACIFISASIIIFYNYYFQNYFVMYIYIMILSPLIFKYVSYCIEYSKKYLRTMQTQKKINDTILFNDILIIQPEISDECNICLENFQKIDPVILLPCGCLQLYHESCIREWIHENPTCPTCRKEL